MSKEVKYFDEKAVSELNDILSKWLKTRSETFGKTISYNYKKIEIEISLFEPKPRKLVD